MALSLARLPLQEPVTASGASALIGAVFKELYLEPGGRITMRPQDPSAVAKIAADGKAVLADTSGTYNFETRRLVVNALKAAQNDQAYFALNDARDALNAKLAEMSPSDRALTQELVARITAAITPYFQ